MKKTSGKNRNVVKIYLDMTDFYHHIPDDPNGIRVYFKKKDLLKHEKCVREGGCGIVRLELDLDTKKVIRKENLRTVAAVDYVDPKKDA